MLSLKLKEGVILFIGDTIAIDVKKINYSNVQINIKAPDHMRILRSDIKKKEHGNAND